ncbi:hypothetical protein BZA77DRAFT_325781 [Pyronema omphalodes]|nr:hypothetical protein BZA77DRAFT_325698 [Pyronema omphalodes]KAI5811977.1 hypothetical protein BZA77DRAFT_325781 [Pyronema omphalodes]
MPNLSSRISGASIFWRIASTAFICTALPCFHVALREISSVGLVRECFFGRGMLENSRLRELQQCSARLERTAAAW